MLLAEAPNIETSGWLAFPEINVLFVKLLLEVVILAAMPEVELKVEFAIRLLFAEVEVILSALPVAAVALVPITVFELLEPDNRIAGAAPVEIAVELMMLPNAPLNQNAPLATGFDAPVVAVTLVNMLVFPTDDTAEPVCEVTVSFVKLLFRQLRVVTPIATDVTFILFLTTLLLVAKLRIYTPYPLVVVPLMLLSEIVP
jgi:hypothetical protein